VYPDTNIHAADARSWRLPWPNQIDSRLVTAILHRRRVLLVLAQLLIVVLSNYTAMSLRFDGRIPPPELALFVHFLPWLVLVRGLSFIPFRLYEGLWRYTGVSDVCNITEAVLLSSGVCVLLLLLQPQYGAYPRSVVIIDSLLLVIVLSGVRLTRRLVEYIRPRKDGRRVLIYGAGEAGAMIVDHMRSKACGYVPIGFIDDNGFKIGKYIHGVRVVGRMSDLPRIVGTERPDELLIAMPATKRQTVREIVRLLEPFKIPIKTVPALRDILDGRVDVSHIRDLTVEDLLTRSPVDLNGDPLRTLIAGQCVLVTGAGGSIGSELARQVAALGPSKLVLFERYENTLHDLIHQLTQRFGRESIYPVIGDVTDAVHVNLVMEQYRPDLVFHAAAHKHVPLMEMNPCEAIKNNVVGTATVAHAALDHGVERFIFISTDKAVNPSSVMGASKRIAEKILHDLSYRGATRFSAVRFGNVLGSNGSVLPRFIEQIKAGGPVTVTHPEIRRYFMLIPEAVQLVLHAATLSEPGFTYVLEMGDPIKLVDLARHVIRLAGYVPDDDIPITFVGLRPGEKLYEELVGAAEVAEPSGVPSIMRVRSTEQTEIGTFERELDALVRAATIGDRDSVMRQLRHMLPTLALHAVAPTAAPPVAVASAWSANLRGAAAMMVCLGAILPALTGSAAQRSSFASAQLQVRDTRQGVGSSLSLDDLETVGG